MNRLISFDIDGTMIFGQPPGHITLDLVRRAKELGFLIGSASDRTIGNQRQLWEVANIKVDFVTLKHHLPDLRKRFEVSYYLHVGDTELDKYFAHQAGFDFLLINDVPADGSDGWLTTPASQKPGGATTTPARSTASEITVVQRPALSFVGMEVLAESEMHSLELSPPAWQRLYAQQDEIKHRYGQTFADVNLGWANGRYRRLIGAEVTEAGVVPQGMTLVEMPAQRYLFRRHTGPRSGVAETFGSMYDWARRGGHATGAVRVDVGYLPGADETYHDLLICLSAAATAGVPPSVDGEGAWGDTSRF